MHAFVAGDFNANGGEEKDNVCHLLGTQGWTSTFTEVHGSSAGVTHLTHRNEQLAVDFICQQHPSPYDHTYIHYRPASAHVIPSEIPHTTWPTKAFTASDHRPVLVTFSPFIHISSTSTSTSTPSTSVVSSTIETTSSSSTSTVTPAPSKHQKGVTTAARSAAVVVDDTDEVNN
jgi:hypothetical protein